MNVRSARPEDAERLLALRCALWPGIDVERQRGMLRLRAGSPARHETFIGVDGNGVVCGFIELTRDPGAPGEPATVAIDGIFVAPAARRRGVARDLLLGAERWAHGRGATSLCCEVDAANGAHLEAMAWLGFGDHVRRVRLRRAVSAMMDIARDAGPAAVPSGTSGAVPRIEPALVMEPARGRGFLYFNLVLLVVAIFSFAFTDIYARDMVRGVLLPLLDAVLALWFLFVFMMLRYRKRADSTARAERLFRQDG